MDSDQEYEDSDPDFDEEQEGYDEFLFETMLNNSSENNNIRNGLLKEKMELLLRFNLNKPGNYILDPELYRSNLNEINERLNEVEIVTEDLTNELIDKEIEFVITTKTTDALPGKAPGERIPAEKEGKFYTLNVFLNSYENIDFNY